jgi:hypothetical protein
MNQRNDLVPCTRCAGWQHTRHPTYYLPQHVCGQGP